MIRVVAVTVLLVSGAACSPAEPGFEPPSAIILISLDTLRADMLGLYGYETYPTSPFLDALSAESVVFENEIVQAPRTLSSHISLFTGLSPHRHGVDDRFALSPDIPTLAQRLSEHGYRTQAFADAGYLRARWGFPQGFDAYDEGDSSGFASILPRARRWLKTNGDAPFFLFLHTYDLHTKGRTPYYPSPVPFRGMFSSTIDSELDASSRSSFEASFRARKKDLDRLDERFIKASYAEGIRHVDEMLQGFFETLRGYAWYDQALIVIWSDHGEGLYDHEDYSHGEVFDHTIRVPLMIRFPGGAYGGLRVRTVVQSLDIAPTLLELAGAAPLEQAEGRSLVPLLHEEDDERVAFSARTRKKQRRFSLRTSRYHYIWHGRPGLRFLFDVRDDPHEKRNLIGTGLPAEDALRERLEVWVKKHDRIRSLPRHVRSQAVDAETEADLRALGYLE